MKWQSVDSAALSCPISAQIVDLIIYSYVNIHIYSIH